MKEEGGDFGAETVRDATKGRAPPFFLGWPWVKNVVRTARQTDIDPYWMASGV